VFTDSPNSFGNKHPEQTEYIVSPHIRVRKEPFGLLFFNTQNTKLTFVKSGEILQVRRIPMGNKLVFVSEGDSRQNLKKTLANLVHRGIILES
jgi:putative mycofactocin binding protein MftB